MTSIGGPTPDSGRIQALLSGALAGVTNVVTSMKEAFHKVCEHFSQQSRPQSVNGEAKVDPEQTAQVYNAISGAISNNSELKGMVETQNANVVIPEKEIKFQEQQKVIFERCFKKMGDFENNKITQYHQDAEDEIKAAYNKFLKHYKSNHPGTTEFEARKEFDKTEVTHLGNIKTWGDAKKWVSDNSVAVSKIKNNIAYAQQGRPDLQQVVTIPNISHPGS